MVGGKKEEEILGFFLIIVPMGPWRSTGLWEMHCHMQYINIFELVHFRIPTTFTGRSKCTLTMPNLLLCCKKNIHKALSSSSSSSSVMCQSTVPKTLPNRFPHIVQSRASSLNWEYPLLSLRSSSSFLCLLPCLLVTTICPFIFPSVTSCRRQFLRKM